MTKYDVTSQSILQLEETLQILEEIIGPVSLSSLSEKQHIQRLKQFYSPQFDFEHSETGSYYYAALMCVHDCYVVNNSENKLPLSPIFKESVYLLLEISRLSLGIKRHKQSVTETLLLLSKLWGLNETLDIPTLLLRVFTMMRSNLLDTCH